MAESEVSGQSTTNRRYKYDLKICCHCQNIHPRFLLQIQNRVIQHVSNEISISDFKALFEDSVSVLYVQCQHNVNSIKDIVQQCYDTYSGRLILCTTDANISLQNNTVEHILVDLCESSSTTDARLLRKIQFVLNDSKLYDDTGTSVAVERSESVYDINVDDIEQYGPQSNEHSTESPHYVEGEHLYEPLNHYSCPKDCFASNQFIEAKTLKPKNNGIQILDRFCLPTGTENGQEDINLINNVKLPKLQQEHRLKDIAEHLNIGIPEIYCRVIETLTDVCFTLPSTSESSFEIQSVLQIVWAFLNNWKGDVVMVKSVTLLSNLLIAKLFFLSLNGKCEKKKLINFFDKELIRQISFWLKIKEIDKKIHTFLHGSQLLMEDFLRMVQKDHSFIHLGEWKISLRHEGNQKQLLTAISKTSPIEQTACVLSLICLACDTTVHITALPTLVEKTVKNCFAILKKRKEISMVYSFSILATRSIVYLINSMEDKEDAQSYMNSVKNILMYKPWTKHQKETLSQEIKHLSMHPSLTIRYEVLTTLALMKADDMGQITRTSLQNSCQSGRLFITKEVKCYGKEKQHHSKPHWSECIGFFGDVQTSMKILIPSKNCIAKSVDDKYKTQQTTGNERFSNTLTILSEIQQTGGHENIIRLIAYQSTKMPLFYAIQTEDTMNLLKFLLSRREQKQWCSLSTLYRLIRDAISAISHLHAKNIVHRDITSCRFTIVLGQMCLKMSEFRLAKKLQRSTDTLCLDDSVTLAVRWSAVESLKQDEFSVKSDTWMFSMFMYEVFTHGCWPYSELVDKETGDIMHMVIIRGYNQYQPRCIPEKIFRIMLSCLERRAEKRLSMTELEAKIIPLQPTAGDETGETKASYPKLLKQQKENAWQPELGVPDLVHQLKDRTAVPYYNTRMRATTAHPLQHEDLIADFEPEITKDVRRGTITVTERLGTFAKQYNLPYHQRLKEIIARPSTRPQKIVDTGETYLTYTYKTSEDGDTLIDHAFKHSSHDDLTKLLLRLAKLIQRFHDNGWIVRCFSAKDVWITDKNKVCLLRLGRACKLDNDTTGEGHVKDNPFKDRMHWLPLEVHRDGCYTSKSDVYMFAMVVYEVFTAMFFNRENPLRNQMYCVPFSMTPRGNLQDVLQDGDVPDKPEYCPVSLYKIMCECWSRDVVSRPSIADVVRRLKDIRRRKDFKIDDDDWSETSMSIEPDYSSFSESDSDSEDDENVDTTKNRSVTTGVPPRLPERNAKYTSQRSSIADSCSNESFPGAPPRVLHNLPNRCTPASRGSSHPQCSSTKEGKLSGPTNRKQTALMEKQYVKRKDPYHYKLTKSSNIYLPDYNTATRYVAGTVDEDYITPTSSRNTIYEKSVARESSGSNDSFPSGPPIALK